MDRPGTTVAGRFCLSIERSFVQPPQQSDYAYMPRMLQALSYAPSRGRVLACHRDMPFLARPEGFSAWLPWSDYCQTYAIP